ncbi:MAG: hypothetical protein GX075_05995 [Firmicutes bacterium]|nr:hypothetical protein [Bacillota bacterium]
MINRTGLTGALQQAKAHRLFLLAAPAGYGKTVLIRQYLAGLDKPFVWYQLDRYDKDPVTFMEYLFAGIRLHFPDFGKNIDPKKAAANPKLAASALADSFSDIANRGGLALALDDYHEINSAQIDQLLQEIIPNLPLGIQIIIAGRLPLPFDISPSIMANEATILGVNELRFNLEETSSLLSQRRIKVSEKVIAELTEKTGGWPAALWFVNDPDTANLLAEGGNHETIHNYLASEVFEFQPEKIRDFLLSTSVLETLVPEICDQLLNRKDSRWILSFLEKQQLFLSRLSGSLTEYRYHQFFRKFLLERLGERRFQLLRRAGRLARIGGNIDQAMEYMIAAGVDSETLTVFKEAGLKALRQGRWLTVARWLENLTEAQIAAEPWLSFFKGQVLTYRGQMSEAELWAIQAEKGFRMAGEQSGIIESRILHARILRSRGCYRKSIELLEEAATNLPSEAKEQFDLILEKTLCLIIMGRLQEAETILCKTLDEAKKRDDQYFIAHLAEGLGNVYYLQGKYFSAMNSYQWGLRISPDRFLPGYYMQDSIADIYKDWGQLDQALEFAKRNVELKERFGLTEALPSAYNQLGYVYFEIGEITRANEYFRRGVEAARQANQDRYFNTLNNAYLGWVYSMQGDWVKGRAMAEKAFIDAKELSGLAYPVCQMILGTILVQTEETERARIMLEESALVLEEMGVWVQLCNNYKALAWLYDQLGMTKKFQNCARRYLQLASKLNYIRGFLPFTYHLLRPILKFGLIKGLEVSFIQRILVQLKEKSLELLDELALDPDPEIRKRIMPLLTEIGGEEAVKIRRTVDEKSNRHRIKRKILLNQIEVQPEKNPTPILRIRMFGPFQVFCRNTEITSDNWRTIKSRDLLAYLIHQDRPVNTDQIIEDLWPNLNSDKASAVFRSNLYYLRRTLTRFIDEELIIRGTKCYQLRHGSVVTDRCEFEKMAGEFLRKPITDSIIDKLEESIALYRGDYLADLDYPWVLPIQEELKNMLFEIKRRLSIYYFEHKDYRKAVDHLRQLMAVKPFSKENLALLMRSLAQIGDIQGVKEQYLIYAKKVFEELGSSPSVEIKTLYNDLCNRKKAVSQKEKFSTSKPSSSINDDNGGIETTN